MTPTHPRLLPDRDKRFRFYLDEDVTIELPQNSSLTVSKGYRFDGHSVPWCFRWLFPKYNAQDVYCALVHDALIDFESMHRYNRKYQDMIYRRMMRDPRYKANAWRAFWMPTAVRFFGWLAYDLFGDYRGEPKSNTHIVVKVIND